MNEQKSVWPAAIVIMLLLVCATFWITYAVQNKNIEVDTSKFATKDDLNNGLVALNQNTQAAIQANANTNANTNEVVVTDRANEAYNKILVEDDKKSTALNLANSELATISFKKDVFYILEENTSIENYKEITNFKVIDSDTEVDGDEAVVTFDMKVYYFIDGDDEETQKAKIEVVCTINGLDEDEDFADAEAECEEVSLLKIYE